VLFYSSETPELVNLCHRVIVLYGGQVAEVLPSRSEDVSEKSIMRAALGQRSALV
jgi:ribose transport system ATP-binding protein